LKNSPFTWFDKLTTGFDGPVLSEDEGLKVKEDGFKTFLPARRASREYFTFMLSLVEARKLFFNSVSAFSQQETAISCQGSVNDTQQSYILILRNRGTNNTLTFK